MDGVNLCHVTEVTRVSAYRSPVGFQIVVKRKLAPLLWDVPSRGEKMTLEGTASEVLSVAISPDGKLVAAGSQDETLKLWDAATRTDPPTPENLPDRFLGVA